MSKVLLTRVEVSELLGVSLVTLNKWVKSNKIPAIKIGSRVRFDQDELFKKLKEYQDLTRRRNEL